MDLNQLTENGIGAAIEVHRTPGAGLLESAYLRCLCHELTLRSIAFECERALPVHYKGIDLLCGYKIDILIANTVVIELKAVEKLQPVHDAQLPTYLRLVGWNVGLQ